MPKSCKSTPNVGESGFEGGGGGNFSFGGYIICFWGNVLIGGKDLLGFSLSLHGFYYWGKIINFWGSDY